MCAARVYCVRYCIVLYIRLLWAQQIYDGSKFSLVDEATTSEGPPQQQQEQTQQTEQQPQAQPQQSQQAHGTRLLMQLRAESNEERHAQMWLQAFGSEWVGRPPNE
eukprot:COSAG06_NODE_28420_length_574_cov_3.320000_1_plen_106_part_00